ncbi:MAG TPA: glycosyltransferase family 39 protein [Marmoricola sp.]|jgi:4-amino-4-deoxy-L-arabinose transferase-like glycosyltransferase|nr:glycosyltransferase family 39 protein [Marmoricola sp.]
MQTTTSSFPQPLARLAARGERNAGHRGPFARLRPSATRTATGAPDPAWARPALALLLVATAVLYLWGLSGSGWANSFYSAAVQAGSESWKAFFFGSSDASNSITVDKTPLSLWPMALSVRLFGLSSWSILVPQAIEGVATVALLHRTVRRTTGSVGAGLIAGAALALTPVAVLMFRFNNPDAMLVLLLTAAGAVTLRAVEESKKAAAESPHPLRWLVLAGSLVGLAFLTKMLQAFLVLPALALVYLLCAHTPIGKRFAHLLAAFGAMILSAGWWVAIVQFWPAASRPYIGGSQHNSILELTLGYNGFGRLSGNETGSVGGGGGGGNAAGNSMWGATGIGRMFNSEMGGQIAWLLPAALLLGAGSLWIARRDAKVRAAVIVWGTTLLVTGLTFSFMAGIFHSYYTVALAPAIAALVGIGTWALWQDRHDPVARAVMAVATGATSVMAFVLLGRSSDFLPWLRPLVIVVGLGAALALLGVHRLGRRAAMVIAAAAMIAGIAGPAAYAVQTASTSHTGSLPTAGPSTGANGFGGGPGGGGPGGGGFGGRGGFGGQPPQGQTGQTGQAPTGAQNGTGGQQGGAGGGAPSGGGGAGGLLNGSTSTATITAMLKADASDYTWAAAAVGSNTASGYQLASQEPVMAIGGFNGSDPSPTLAQFKTYVAAGKIHYFIGSGSLGGSAGGSNDSSEIASWVAANYTAKTVDGVTLYDLTASAS